MATIVQVCVLLCVEVMQTGNTTVQGQYSEGACLIKNTTRHACLVDCLFSNSPL